MGSEMCIRDRFLDEPFFAESFSAEVEAGSVVFGFDMGFSVVNWRLQILSKSTAAVASARKFVGLWKVIGED